MNLSHFMRRGSVSCAWPRSQSMRPSCASNACTRTAHFRRSSLRSERSERLVTTGADASPMAGEMTFLDAERQRVEDALASVRVHALAHMQPSLREPVEYALSTS